MMRFDFSKLSTPTLHAIELEAADAAERGDAPVLTDQAARLAAVRAELERRGEVDIQRERSSQHPLALDALAHAMSPQTCRDAVARIEARAFMCLTRRIERSLERAQAALSTLLN